MIALRQWRRALPAAAVVAALACAGAADAADGGAHDAHQHHHGAPAPAEGAAKPSAVRGLPGVTLVREDGVQVRIDQEAGDRKPVVLAFIYTSCTAVCPVTSQILSQVQDKLGSARSDVKLISVSIDPEYDTPARLRQYAQKFGAGPAWKHYTGTRADSVAVQKAFGAYAGDKMNHQPALFVRPAGSSQWLRLEGFPRPEAVVKQLKLS